MALNMSMRRLMKKPSASGLCYVTRWIKSHSQSNFTGVKAVAMWNNGHGFGFNADGDLVIVRPQGSGVVFFNSKILQQDERKNIPFTVLFFNDIKRRMIANGHNYGLLFNYEVSIQQPGQLEPEPQRKRVRDRDLWIEGQTSNNRGVTPWSKPFVPRHGPCCAGVAKFSSLAGDGYTPKSGMPTSLVIFDKDGTLIDVNSVWIPWMEAHVNELEELTGMDLADKLYSAVGFCPVKKEYKDESLLAHAPIADIKNRIKEVLVESGLEESEARTLVEGCCDDFDTGSDEILEPLGDLTKIFETLKSRGVKTAVCTMDSRSGTMSALDQLGLTSLVDTIICGDDRISQPKPAPDNALNICKVLDVCPSRTAVIGDTTADTGMGRSAGLGLTIGVLSGVGSKAALEKESDVLLNNVDELLGVIFKN